MKKIIATIFFLLFFLLLFSFTLKGKAGNPIFYQTEQDTRVGGPFEGSNSSARYALTEAIVNDRTFFLDESLASFSAPDVAESNGKYISLFTPGVSFISVPFYMLGKALGFPQLVTFLSTILFAILNIFLIALIVKKLGGSYLSGILGGFIFAFATNALPYALTLTQHTQSATVVLLAFLLMFGKRTILKNIAFGFLFGIGVLIDIPNAFFLLPIGVYIFSEHFSKEEIGEKIKVNFKLIFFTVIVGLIPLIAMFGIYNYKTTNSYTKLAQSIGRAEIFSGGVPTHLNTDKVLKDAEEKKPSENNLPFNTRLQLNGFYILLLSNERSWIYYSPIVLFGIFGLILLYRDRNNRKISTVAISIVLINIVLYSMFGDPWGGWSFGPRYLIPAAAILSIGTGMLINKYKRNLIFMILFFSVFGYSLVISTVGAMTSNAIPPKVEAVNLKYQIPYTYEYNFKLLNVNESSSLVYNLFLIKIIDAKIYTYSVAGILFFFGTFIYLLNLSANTTNEEKQKKHKYFNFSKSFIRKNKGESNV